MGVVGVGLQSHTWGMQGYNGPEMAEAMGLALRDIFYCCDLYIEQQIIAKKLKRKLCTNSDVL